MTEITTITPPTRLIKRRAIKAKITSSNSKTIILPEIEESLHFGIVVLPVTITIIMSI